MILDRFENIGRYSLSVKLLGDVVKYIESTDINKLPSGRYDIGNTGCFVLRFEYQTKPLSECIIEAHRKYIDVHIVLEGEEGIGLSPVDACEAGEYDEEKDFMPLKGNLECFSLKAGNFSILFPGEAHATGISTSEVRTVKKAVVKIPYFG